MKWMTLFLLFSVTRASAAPPRRTKTLKGHDNFVTSLDLHPEGRSLVSASADGTVRIWSIEAARPRKTIRLPEGDVSRRVLYSPDGKSIAVVVESTVLLLSAAGDEKRRFEPGEPVFSIAFSPDSTSLAVAAGAVRIYLAATGEELAKFGEQVQAVAFSPDGKALLVAGKAGIELHPRPDGALRQIVAGATRDLAFGADGKYVLAAGEDGTVRAVALDSGAEIWSHGDLAAQSRLGIMGSLVLAGIGERRLWALGGEKGKEEWFLEGKTDDLQIFALAPNAKLLATAGEGSTIDLWAWK